MPSTTTSHQGVDPAAAGSVIRIALAVESALTVGMGAYYICFPRHFLAQTMGAAASQVTTAAIQAAQQYGATIAFVGAVVGLHFPNTKLAIESRQPLYRAILAFEVLYVPLLVWQAYTMEGGMSKSALLSTAWQFAPFIAWRIFTLGWKPEWFGRNLERKKLD
ncbi:hypothetical protein CKM354_000931000 [Cercospora kikuchii]|uniref:Uncharacterized protein n=1 Tax=Cercospora kikuchii TaxID=84275 RepID=A0A9P3FJ32_9PEZI|nr:uncharacterized protein CKM354_000931000 [Cercospora kikuchii]GIZ46172.1 hypothetical protein CKM354_000931000 [Cercospora kikuchii]